ncbi:hypothetical protein HYU10_00585 [Candidatus Woesearchaeota archaeon]|nr:hypothetical protein [Candidatus Woesearchaeota archaeon]MBI2130246.1 hypothetical protein [Candidatus Woesearchaeota archaeon]
MKKIPIYLSVFLLAVSMAFAASISRELPSRADPNSELTVNLRISGADPSGVIALEETLPAGITVKDWTVTGAKEAKAEIQTRTKEGRFGWTFTPTSSSASVEYKITLGASDVTFGSLVYFDKAGQGKVDARTLRVAPITCGDGVCEGSENSDNCAGDCPKPAAPAPAPEVKAPEVPEPTKGSGALVALVVVIVIIAGALGYWYTKKGKQ